MRKEENSIELLEQYAMGSLAYDVLKVALESQDEQVNTEETIELFDMAINSLEMGYWKDEIKKIAAEIN